MSVFLLFVVCVVILFVTFFSVFSWFFQSKWIEWKCNSNKKLVYLNDYPLVGASLRFMGDGEDVYAKTLEIAKTYEKEGMFLFKMGFENWLYIFKAEYVQKILSSSKHINKPLIYEFFHPWLKTGLLTSTGSKWSERRKMLTPSFHYNILNDFLVVFNEQALIMCDKLEERIGEEHQEFDIAPYITLCALDIICETVMGKNINAQNDSNCDYITSLSDVCEMILHRQKSPWLWPNVFYYLFGSGRYFDKCLNTLHSFTRNIIEMRQKDYSESEARLMEKEEEVMASNMEDETNVYKRKKRRAFLDLLLYHWHSGELTTDDIQEEVDIFMFGGHDTTSVGMMWALYMIVSHPEVYEKVNQEIEEVFGDSNRQVNREDLKQLQYLEMAMKESQRIYPSVPLIGRTTADSLEIRGQKFPPKQTVSLFIGALHRDPEYFPDPLVFNPDRFHPENIKDRHSYAYIPFSAGRRNCIGQKFAVMEEKTLLSWIFRKFRVETTQAEADIHPEMGLVLKPKYGIKVKIEKR